MTGSPQRVAVVGGGITGLAAAHRLQELARERRLPLSVTLFEASERLGGKIHTVRTGPLILEQGPDSMLVRKPWALDLIRRLGLGGEIVHPTAAAARTYLVRRRRLRLLPPDSVFGIPTGLRAWLRQPILSLPGRLRGLLEPVVPRGGGSDEPIAAFLERRLGREAAAYLAAPFLAGIYGGPAGDLSMDATFPQLKALESRYGSLQRGLSRMRVAAAGSAFFALQGGLNRLTAALARRLGGVDVLTGTAVASVEPLAGGRWRLRADGGGADVFDGVVLATPAPVSAGLLERAAPEAAALLRGIRYRSTAVVTLAYPARLLPRPLDAGGFLVPEPERRLISGCTWSSSKWPHVAPAAVAVLRCFVGGAGDEDALAWPDDRLLAAVREELEGLMGPLGRPLVAHVQRWPEAMPQYAVGHLQRLAALDEAAAALPGLVLAGAGYRGIGVPDCVRQGEEAAAALLGVS